MGRMLWRWAAALVAIAPAGAAQLPAAPATQARVVNAADWLSPDHYPPRALRSGEEGRVTAIVSIDAAGRAIACRIDKPAGLPVLEPYTCDMVLTKGQFEPARDANGRAVATVMPLSIVWKMPADRSTIGRYARSSGPLDMAVIWHVDANDRVRSCEVRVNGLVQPVTADDCRPGPLNIGLGRLLGRQVAYRAGLEVMVRHGDAPPPLPAAMAVGRTLALVEARQIIDGDGLPSACSTRITGEFAEALKGRVPPDHCARGTRFTPVSDGKGVGRAQRMLIATRYMLLPAAK